MMEKIEIKYEWLKRVLPEGFPYPSSTLISGPGGSGKPLIGYMFSSEWLRNGGYAVFMLTSTTKGYLENTMKILGTNLDHFRGKVFFVELDPTIEDDIAEVEESYLKANFVKPEVFDRILNITEKVFGGNTSKMMIVGSALNLLFFSNKYKVQIYKKLKELIEKDKSKTFMFTLNNDVFKDLIEGLERLSDNLMFSRMEEPMKLYLRIERMIGVKFKSEEVEVPLTKQILESIKREAERGKRYLIPTIKKI